MKYTIDPSADVVQLMVLHGVPRGILRKFSIDLKRGIAAVDVSDNPNKPILFSRTLQRQWFRALRNRQPLTPMTIIFSSRNDYLLARQAASIIFWSYLSKAVDQNKTKPYWHFVYAFKRNSMLEDIAAGKFNSPQLLVIDNIHDNMTQNSLANTIDIIQNLCDRPVFLLMNSQAPRELARKLGVKPSMIFEFNTKINAHI